MGKNKRKRKVFESANLLSNLTGYDECNARESLEDCLAEFQPPAEANSASAKVATVPQENLDEIEFWNQSFLVWVQRGDYSPSLLPNIDEEITRNFKVKELSEFLLRSGSDIRMPVFERWLLDSKFCEKQSMSASSLADPVLPSQSSTDSDASLRLRQELLHNQVETERANNIIAELCRKTNIAAQELISQSNRYQRQSSLKKGDRIIQEDHTDQIALVYSRKKWKKPFCLKINRSHYEKLRSRFFQFHNRANTKLDQSNTKTLQGFQILLFCLLLRYSAMSGGQLLQDLRGGGMQGAIHGEVFEVLRSNFKGPWFEGFASPFNVSLESFGSAFPDIDWHFGSKGNFLDYDFRAGGLCEANPPFSPAIMDGMMNHIEKQLARADKNKVSLTFVVVVPSADGDDVLVVKKAASNSFQRMISSSFCQKHIRLAAREHGYLEGSQHLRPTQYKQSTYDTSLIILQSTAAKNEDHNIGKLAKELRSAFKSQHREELQNRRNISNAID